MGTYDHYATPVEPGTWDVPAAGTTKFTWEYDDGRDRLLVALPEGQGQAVGRDQAHRLVAGGRPEQPARAAATSSTRSSARDSGTCSNDGEREELAPAPGRLAVQPVPARRAGRDDLRGPHRRDGAGPRLEVLRRHADDGRGAPRRDVRPVPAGQGRAGLPDQPAPAALLDGRADRPPLGHAVPRHAGAHRGSRARRVRRAARHGAPTRWPSRSSPTSCRTRRGTSRSAGWR